MLSSHMRNRFGVAGVRVEGEYKNVAKTTRVGLSTMWKENYALGLDDQTSDV